MRKDIKIWFGRRLNGANLVEKRGTLKGLCDVLGIKYGTAKMRQDTGGGITLWMVGDEAVWEVWCETVKK